MTTVDVAIIGGGLVGLAFASAIRDCGLGVVVADASAASEAPPSTAAFTGFHSGWSNRVSALNTGSRRFLDGSGAWSRLAAERIGSFRQIRVWDGEGTAEIAFERPAATELGFVVENDHLCRALREVLQSSPAVDLRFGTRLKRLQAVESGYELEFADGQLLTADLVVGADGSRSEVRSLAGIGTRQWRYGQSALVTTVLLEEPHQQVAWQCFSVGGPLAFLPLAEPRLCSIVWSVDHAQCDRLLAMDARGFCAELTRVSEVRLGRVLECDQRSSFVLEQLHAKRYVKNHLALIGDAAHSIHPMAGQGGNLGLQDASLLASEILSSLETGGRAAPDLSRFERIRMPVNLAMMAAMEGFRFLYGRQHPALTFLRNSGMAGVNRSALLKKLIVDYASGELF